jgi:succinate-semialdehyde dehydrogenase/glutarate-semialdehyde dehydrogenase
MLASMRFLEETAMYKDVSLLIDGKWVPAASGRTLAVVSPATGETIGKVAHAERADLDRALEAADKGFRAWRKVSPFDRSKLMRKAADLLRERADMIAPLLTMEQGKPLPEAKGEILAGADVIDWFAEEARRTYGRVVPARAEGVYQLVIKEPVGPVAAFTPWNFPINQVVRKLSCAVAAGCSIIVKAPEETPASPAELIRCFVDAGLPAGVVNLVYGVPSEISEYLIPHPIIRKMSFTGSTAIGKQLAAIAGAHMKRVTMELGGHAPAIVFDDADIDVASKLLAGAKYRNAGQVCVSPTRLMVQDRVFDRFVEGFVKHTKAIKVGDGLESSTNMGPLANPRRIDAMETMIGDATKRGAKVHTGGSRIGNKGNFFEPTVITDVPLDARVMNEEPFGPLAVISRFSSMEDAVNEANRLPYGLASYAYTRSARTANAIAANVEAGMMAINHHGLALPEVPFGGIKDSGYGSEGGLEAIEGYLNTKFVTQANL